MFSVCLALPTKSSTAVTSFVWPWRSLFSGSISLDTGMAADTPLRVEDGASGLHGGLLAPLLPRPRGVRTVRLNVGVWHGNQQ